MGRRQHRTPADRDQDDDDSVSLVLDADLLAQLRATFRSEGMAGSATSATSPASGASGGASAVVRVPLAFAQQMHYYVVLAAEELEQEEREEQERVAQNRRLCEQDERLALEVYERALAEMEGRHENEDLEDLLQPTAPPAGPPPPAPATNTHLHEVPAVNPDLFDCIFSSERSRKDERKLNKRFESLFAEQEGFLDASAEAERDRDIVALVLEASRLEACRLEAARLEASRLEASRLEASRLEASRLEAIRLEARRLEARRLEASRMEAARARLDASRLAAEVSHPLEACHLQDQDDACASGSNGSEANASGSGANASGSGANASGSGANASGSSAGWSTVGASGSTSRPRSGTAAPRQNAFLGELGISRRKSLEQEEDEDGDENPWDAADPMAAHDKYRERAAMFRVRRDQYRQNAQEAFQGGNRSAAGYYTQKARECDKDFEKNRALASAALLATMPNTDTLDLHFYRLGEAVTVVDLFLDHHIRTVAEAEADDEDAGEGVWLTIVTGRGLHSPDNKAVLKPAVLRRVRHRKLRYTEPKNNPGAIRVFVKGDCALSHQFQET